MKYICFVVGVFFFVGCFSKNNIPKNIIKPDEMGTILFEANMAEEFVSSYVAKDSNKNKDVELNKEYQKIFLLHEVTEKQFKESYDFYKANPDIFKALMDSLNARSQKKRTELYQAPL